MKKVLKVVWKFMLSIVVVCSLVAIGVIYTKRDELVTSNITMKYFREVVNENNETQIKEFVANSNNDVLHDNFVSTLNNQYYYSGVSDFNFEIVDKELFGNGKYQCYFANAFENYVPKCDLENEGRYMNYLIDMEITYKLNGEQISQKEKGLVVFVKDMEEGNYFTWKLVRFDRYIISE